MKLVRSLGLISVSALALGVLSFSIANAVRNDSIIDPLDEWGIAVSPATIDTTFVPGGTVTETFRVRNVGSNTGTIKIGVSPLEFEGQSYEREINEQTPRTEITRWTTLSLQPGCTVSDVDENGSLYTNFGYKEECFVDVIINAPLDAPNGSQHMQVYFQEYKETEGEGMRQIKAIGGNVWATNANDANDFATKGCVNIKEHNIPFWTFEAPFKNNALVENCGDLDFYAVIGVDIKNIFGGEAYSDIKYETENGVQQTMVKDPSEQRKIVLAETTRRLENEWKEASIGIYSVTQTIMVGDQEYSATKLAILAPLWMLILIILLVLMIAFWIYTKVRGHKKNKDK